MTWAHPVVLGAAPLAVLGAWWIFRQAGGTAVMARLRHIQRMWVARGSLSVHTPVTRRRLRGFAFTLGVLGAILALARPQWGTIEETSFDQSREVLLALDLSRSMLAEDVSPSRLARAKLLIEALLEQLHGERVGLLVFAGTAFVQSPLSADYEVLREFLSELDPSYLPQGGTDYAALLAAAEKAFGQTGDGDRFLVVLSDGEAHDTAWKSQVAALQQRGIKVIGLGVGTAAGAMIPDGKGGLIKDAQGAVVLSRLEPGTLQELANATGGTYRDAATWVDIAELVNVTVDQGRKGNYVEQRALRLHERYQWFLAPALLAMLLSFWIEFPVFPAAHVLDSRKRTAHTARAVGVAALLLLLWPAPRHASAAVTSLPEAGGQPVPAPQAGPLNPPRPHRLETTVAELSAKAELGAPDYARLATETISFAAKPTQGTPATRIAVIDDALAGVDRGEALDAHASDWPALRKELERLEQLAKQPPPQSQQDSKQPSQSQQEAGGQPSPAQNGGGQQSEQQNAGGQDGQQSQRHGGADGRQQANQDAHAAAPQGSPQGENNPQSEGAREPQNGAAEPQAAGADGRDDAKRPPHDGSDGKNAAAKAQPQRDAAADRQPASHQAQGEVERGKPQALEAADAALGELGGDKREPQHSAGTPPPPDQAAQTRMVGGGPALAAAQAQGNAVLADALAKMERIKDGDAPAVLFERMNQAEGARPPDKTGKNW
jgi:Ca-activated chloride channel family protein